MEDAVAPRTKKLIVKSGKALQSISITHPNAAGIDIGGASHYVAVPADRDDQPVREFHSFTEDLNALADWLTHCNVDTVAIESTGVYWIPVFELLDARGFTVFLVNARHVKNVSGRKSDVLDCQWLQQLMSYGLLRGSFRPSDAICVLRSLWRQRAQLLRDQARRVQHVQKALTQMNIQLANVISDVVGVTGQKILRAIIAGERDRQVLAQMKNGRIVASTEDIAKSLEGNWRLEHLFALKQAMSMFDFIGTQLTECDREVDAQLKKLQMHDQEPAKGKRAGSRNAPAYDLRAQLFKMCGVDLTRIDGINVTTAMTVIAEIGTDMSRFATVGHFTSWLGLCPGTKITGGKIMSGKTKKVVNRATQALKLAAQALRSSQSSLGAYYRRMCARMDKPKAITAAAHKLARLIYTMLTKGEEYTDQGQEYYEERYRQRVLYNLNQKAEKMGMKLVAVEPVV
jgi:transposase